MTREKSTEAIPCSSLFVKLTWLLDRVPSRLDVVGGGLRVLTIGKGGHFAPERTGADGTRHQVRRIKPEGRRVEQDFTLLAKRGQE